MSDTDLQCDCSGAAPEAELSRENPPGRSALLYRIGTHRDFRRRMLAALAAQPPSAGSPARPLSGLDTHAADDPAIGLLDAWAVTLDVLTFYQERLANEGFLRTATERRSVLELARDVGYELAPGVAASAFLAFIVEDSTPTATVPAGAQVQSLPGQDQVPQTFETTAPIEARAEWNAIRPRQSFPQRLFFEEDAGNARLLLAATKPGAAAAKPTELFFEGTSTNLRPGDALLFEQPASALPPGEPPLDRRSVVATAVIRSVQVQSAAGRTRVTIALDAARPLGGVSLDPDPSRRPPVTVFALRQRVSFFGNNAPPFKDTLPPPTPPAPQVPKAPDPPHLDFSAAAVFAPIAPGLLPILNGISSSFDQRVSAYQKSISDFQSVVSILWDGQWITAWSALNWDSGLTIWSYSNHTPWPGGAHAFLERTLSEIVPGSWVIFKDPRSDATAAVPFRVDKVIEASVADFTISTRGTGLRLRDASGELLPAAPLDPFGVRTSTAYVQSEALALVDLPASGPISAGDTTIALDGVVTGLHAGQPVWISGASDDAPNVKADEVVFLTGAEAQGGVTTLTLADPLRLSYDRTKTAINANVAVATHGETVQREVLGSGDASLQNQQFKLQRPDVTHVSAPTESGAASTVSIRVSGVPWREVPSLHDQDGNAQVYSLSIDDDHRTTVTFGDGVNGARLPTGTENVVASYRTSVTADGALGPGTLTLLQTRPLGVSRVTNPLATTGADGPDSLEEGRVNAPFAVRTLGRVVTLQDYEDFARAFGGVGKAKAAALSDGRARIVHISAVSDHGETIDRHSALHDNLLKALGAVADPAQEVRIDGAGVRSFRVSASLVLDPRRLASDVLSSASAALLSAFSLARRDLGQSVAPGDVINVLQRVPGVVAALLRQLSRTGEPAPRSPVTLAARPARIEGRTIVPAELLLIDPNGVELTETDQ